MSEYLEGLGGDATLGDVFYDLYGQAGALVAELDELRAAEYGAGTSQKPVPGTSLEMNWCAVSDEKDGSYLTTDVSAYYFGNRSTLFCITKHQQSRNATPPAATGIRGYRGNELSGDYRLALREPDSVDYTLRHMGIRGTLKNNEPIGESTQHIRHKVNDLIGDDRHRLVVVTQGILDNLTAAEWIRDGQSPVDVFAAMNRELIRY